MFLQIPQCESHVAGMNLRCEVIPENIAEKEGADALIDEHLSVVVEHDGSNPFCDQQQCIWILCMVMASGEILPQLHNPEDSEVQFLCLPHGIHVAGLIVCEHTINDVTGIWLYVQTNEEDGGHDCAFCLVRYAYTN